VSQYNNARNVACKCAFLNSLQEVRSVRYDDRFLEMFEFRKEVIVANGNTSKHINPLKGELPLIVLSITLFGFLK